MFATRKVAADISERQIPLTGLPQGPAGATLAASISRHLTASCAASGPRSWLQMPLQSAGFACLHPAHIHGVCNKMQPQILGLSFTTDACVDKLEILTHAQTLCNIAHGAPKCSCNAQIKPATFVGVKPNAYTKLFSGQQQHLRQLFMAQHGGWQAPGWHAPTGAQPAPGCWSAAGAPWPPAAW